MATYLVVSVLVFGLPFIALALALKYSPRRSEDSKLKIRAARILSLNLGPVIFVFVAVVVVGSISYDGMCGGGFDSRKTPCSFYEFVEQNAFWAAMMLLAPGIFSMILSGGVVAFRLIGRPRDQRRT